MRPFPREEYEERIGRLRAVMAKRAIDALNRRHLRDARLLHRIRRLREPLPRRRHPTRGKSGDGGTQARRAAIPERRVVRGPPRLRRHRRPGRSGRGGGGRRGPRGPRHEFLLHAREALPPPGKAASRRGVRGLLGRADADAPAEVAGGGRNDAHRRGHRGRGHGDRPSRLRCRGRRPAAPRRWRPARSSSWVRTSGVPDRSRSAADGTSCTASSPTNRLPRGTCCTWSLCPRCAGIARG